MKKGLIGGKLKFKRALTVKKSIRKLKVEEEIDPELEKGPIPEIEEPQMIMVEPVEVPKTPAEMRHEKTLKSRLRLRIDEALKKTHRERIDEYNKKLAKLPEHFDIPRIGPG